MVDLKGKKLLILAGASVHNKVVKAAKEMGIYTIVADYLADSPAKLIADESWMYSITDVDDIVERCRKEKVDGVLNFCIDPGQKPYQLICEKLDLPCYMTKEQVETFTDKKKFKKFCTENNVDIIPDYTEEDILADKASYPIYIKPSNSRGSRGQSVCYNKEEAIKGIETAKKESSDGQVVCEKFMEGKQDIGSAFFVVDGEAHLVKFGDRYLGEAKDNLNKQVMCTRLPSAFSPVFIDKVMPKVKEMIKTLGIKFGPVFLQGFVDGETVRYYDPALRMPGGDYDLILKEATGFDTVKSLIHFALTGDEKTAFGNPKNAFLLNGGTAILITISVKPGLIHKIEGFEQVVQLPDVVYGRQMIFAGEEIPDSGDISQRVAAFGLYIKAGNSVKESIEKIYDIYKVLDKEGNDMIISKVDANKRFII